MFFQIQDSWVVMMYINVIWTNEYKESSEIDDVHVFLGQA